MLPSLSLGACLGLGLLFPCLLGGRDSADAVNCRSHSSTILAQANKSSKVSSGRGGPNFSLTRLDRNVLSIDQSLFPTIEGKAFLPNC